VTEFLVPATLWWEGRLRTGEALRLSGGAAAPVPLDAIPAGAERRAFPGTLLPGILDAHVHSGLVDLAVVRAGGVANVWDLGSVPSRVADLAGRAGFPSIRYAGPFLTAPGGYPSDRSWAAPGSWRAIGSASQAGEVVGAVFESGATLIKVTAHAGGPQMDVATMTAVVQAAHELGLPVVVHAEGPGTVVVAYETGADILAHAPWTEPLDPALVRVCAERMQWISTLDIHGWGSPTREQTTAIGNLRRFLEYGGRVRYGTDLGNGPLPPTVNPREIRALQSAGLTPGEILVAMTDDGVSWIPGGLDLSPVEFADVMATVRVVRSGGSA
jgi:imidazolonepropionase-like amidohydrolase